MPQWLYTCRKTLRYPLDGRLRGPQSRSGSGGEENGDENDDGKTKTIFALIGTALTI